MTKPITSAMAFVVAVRLIIQGVAYALASPIVAIKSRLPDTDGPTFPRLIRLKSWCADRTLARLPEWVEYKGSFMLFVKTDIGSNRLEALVNRIPGPVIDGWLKFAIATMAVFLVAWGLLLLAGLALAARATWILIQAGVEWGLAYDWLSLFEPQPAPEYNLVDTLVGIVASIPEIALMVGSFAIAFGISILFCWLLMVLLMPGLVLHEFGHYAAVRNAGASVDSFGLLLFGPLLGGAFVEPGDDVEDLHAEQEFGVWSAGLANSLLWGTCLLVSGGLLSGDPGAVIEALYTGQYGVLSMQPVSALLLVVGFVEMANAFLNAVPFGQVDGGGFIRTAEQEWWDFDESVPFDQRLKHVLRGREGAGA